MPRKPSGSGSETASFLTACFPGGCCPCGNSVGHLLCISSFAHSMISFEEDESLGVASAARALGTGFRPIGDLALARVTSGAAVGLRGRGAAAPLLNLNFCANFGAKVLSEPEEEVVFREEQLLSLLFAPFAGKMAGVAVLLGPRPWASAP